MNKKILIVGALRGELRIGDDPGLAIPATWAEGMIGVVPVFESFETAEKCYGDKYFILPMQIVENR